MPPRIATIVATELVDLVEHQYRVVRLGAPHRLNQAARHGADVRPAMAAQFGFVVHTAQAHALELASQRPSDRLAQRRFADARRADEAKDRRLGVRVQLQHARCSRMRSFTSFRPKWSSSSTCPGVRDVQVVLAV